MNKTTYLLLLFPYFLMGQNLPTYLPIIDQPANIDSVLHVLDTRYKNDIAFLPNKNKEDYIDFYKKRYEKVSQSLKEGHYLFDVQIEDFLDSMLDEICNANPEIPKSEIRLLLGRYPWPNATCVGEGSIILNVGLLRRLENESQLAFVICHEIAHYTLNHSDHSIERKVKQLNSSEIKKEIRNIESQKYGAGKKSRDLLVKIIYDDRKHSREHEEQADEIGLKYLKNTKYDALEAKNVLKILDAIDKEKYAQHSTHLKSVFNAEEYPFKEKWIAKEELIKFDTKENFGIDSDSLKTHPDCETRLTELESQLSDYKSQFVMDTSIMYFSDLVYVSDFEKIEAYIYFENFEKAVYYSLKLLNEYPETPYLYAAIGRSFHLLHTYQSEHNLANPLDFPQEDDEEEYQENLRFFQKIRLKEMVKVNYYFLEKVADKFINDEDFLFAWIMANDKMKYTETTDNLKEIYFEKFPVGLYTDYLTKHVSKKE